jgi:predicted permease
MALRRERRWLIRQLEQLPLDEVTKRALVESVADAHYERRGLVVALTRVVVSALFSFAAPLHPFRHFGQDIRAAARRLRAGPLYAVFAVCTLALAIGSATAIYAVVDAVLVQRQPIRDFDRVVNIYHSDPRTATVFGKPEMSWLDFEDIRRAQQSFAGVAAWHRFPYALVSDNGSMELVGESVTGNYFPILDVTPLLGRTLTPADDQPGATPVIVLSEHIWQRLFLGSASAIGDTVRIGGVRFEVVGVMPGSFRGSDMPVIMPTPFWIPLASEDLVPIRSGYRRLDKSDRDLQMLWVKARLRRGVTLDAARAEVAVLASRLDATGWAVVPMKDIYLHESMHRMVVPMLSLLLGLVVLVLLVACSNLANLTLARTARRSQDLAIRLALGASRGRLIREQLVEGVLVTVAGWCLGILVAKALLPWLGASADVNASITLTIQLHPQLNPAVLAVSLAAALLALAVTSLGPALKHSRGNVRGALVGETSVTSAPRWRTRGSLIAGQVIVSTLLLAISAVYFNQIRQSNRWDSGIDLDRLAIVKYDFGFNQTDPQRVRQEIDALAKAAQAIPGVEHVALSTGLPFGVQNPGADVEGHYTAALVSTSSIFETLGVRLVAGRAFDDTKAGGPLTAVISEKLAGEIFQSTEAAIGRPIQYRRGRLHGEDDPPVLTLTVVGVAADTDVRQLGRRDSGTVYVPLNQHTESAWTAIARVHGDPAPIVSRMKEVMRHIDPELALSAGGTGLALSDPSMLVYEVATAIAGTLGVFAVLLAAIGLYGVIADLVSRRTREIGIRIALGAERASVVRMVFSEGMRPVMAGVFVGIGVASIVRMAMGPMFQRMIPASDAAVIIIGLLPLLAAAVAACYIPARRAARVDPNVALREL